MNSRDEYMGDYTLRFWPRTDPAQFYEDFFNPSGMNLQLIVVPEKKMQEIKELESKNQIIVASIALPSLIIALAHSKIPYLNRVRGWWKRIPMMAAIFFIPSNIAALALKTSSEAPLAEIFKTHAERYELYKLTGDIRSFGEGIEPGSD